MHSHTSGMDGSGKLTEAQQCGMATGASEIWRAVTDGRTSVEAAALADGWADGPHQAALGMAVLDASNQPMGVCL